MPAPIELQFYDENDEPIGEPFRVYVIRFGMLKKAAKLQTQLDAKGEDAVSDAIAQFVIELFGMKFSAKDLEEKADLGQVMAAFQAVNARAMQLAGPVNFQPGRG